jgi:hypothetical protein
MRIRQNLANSLLRSKVISPAVLNFPESFSQWTRRSHKDLSVRKDKVGAWLRYGGAVTPARVIYSGIGSSRFSSGRHAPLDGGGCLVSFRFSSENLPRQAAREVVNLRHRIDLDLARTLIVGASSPLSD